MTDDAKTAQHLNAQHPNPWTRGTWYPAKLQNGQEVQIKRTSGKGPQAGKHYLHIRKRIEIHVKSEAGEILDVRPGWDYFQIRLYDPDATLQYQSFD